MKSFTEFLNETSRDTHMDKYQETLKAELLKSGIKASEFKVSPPKGPRTQFTDEDQDRKKLDLYFQLGIKYYDILKDPFLIKVVNAHKKSEGIR